MVFQQGRRESGDRGVPSGYVAGDGRLRTKLEAIFNICSFHRHALGKIPRLIDVRTTKHCDVVGEQL
jgi:hypothetical protein